MRFGATNEHQTTAEAILGGHLWQVGPPSPEMMILIDRSPGQIGDERKETQGEDSNGHWGARNACIRWCFSQHSRENRHSPYRQHDQRYEHNEPIAGAKVR